MPATREELRLAALRQLNLLDTPPSEAFDRITRMAAHLFQLPIAAVSLTDQDRQWFKSRFGVDHDHIPRHKAPCAQVAESGMALVVPDLLQDSFYRDSHLARNGIRFYAGTPLITREGYCLGAMCVLGTSPRAATAEEMNSLHDLAAMVMAQVELQHAAGRIDPISGLPNRNQFEEDLADLAREHPDNPPRVAMLVDLLGPEQAGNALRVLGTSYLDEMVSRVVAALREGMAPGERAYQASPTQYVVLGPAALHDEAEATAWLRLQLDRMSTRVEAHFLDSLVVGIAPFHIGQTSARDILRMAYCAAHAARAQGRRFGFYSAEDDEAHRRRFRLMQDFALALREQGQLRLVYQPRMDIATRSCLGAEALLRWRHPILGEISPGEFIPIIERTALALPLTTWVLDQAMRQRAAWQRAGLAPQISVNVSAANLRERDFATRVRACLDRHDLPVDAVELEITESAVMEDAAQALTLLRSLSDDGIRLAIDDFGTGYSSLSYLQRIPAQVVKVDRAFLRDIGSDSSRRALVEAIVTLSHRLGYAVVAEGVETPQVLDMLAELGCDEAQGYLFAPPLPAEEFEAWYRRHGGMSQPPPEASGRWRGRHGGEARPDAGLA
ncbi:sensor domain-containing phosphodiesterase [Roseomonas sp. GC11]|uniref:putative bifunctional diguanylate cyclase/phosphodiesterase n=1 Tax=Roseomonas sp. GC11 TaxID=2950546 RepID=UPI00210AA148|nr:sensor domain-containing phosphodiesterase [Roseomonas sp. GC11]MCQ4162352.1 sensor domain-containing phosphodiesterase [Roseomonas sp. GC11]